DECNVDNVTHYSASQDGSSFMPTIYDLNKVSEENLEEIEIIILNSPPSDDDKKKIYEN
ncbi:6389_t:CDS:2, partial [Dentiscutata erythropus]